MKKIIGIMAATADGVIGYNNGLPWDYPEELKHFRAMIDGHAIIMGRKTYDTMPLSTLRTVDSIVFSRNPHFTSDVSTVVNSIDMCLKHLHDISVEKTIFMIGGAEIAHLFLSHNLVTSFILTKIYHRYTGDTYMNLGYFEGWPERVVQLESNYAIVELMNPK